jgi:hypothetical protein
VYITVASAIPTSSSCSDQAPAPNYQAGKDMIAGFKRTYRGRIAGEILFKFGETDYQADLSKVRAMAPEAVFVFAPGGMGVFFLKQWASSGLRESVKLYTLYVVDNATLPAIGEAAIGSVHTGHWNPDLDHPRNRESAPTSPGTISRPRCSPLKAMTGHAQSPPPCAPWVARSTTRLPSPERSARAASPRCAATSSENLGSISLSVAKPEPGNV